MSDYDEAWKSATGSAAAEGGSSPYDAIWQSVVSDITPKDTKREALGPAVRMGNSLADAAVAAGKKSPSKTLSAGMGLVQGATLGFGDELAALIGAPIDALRNGTSLSDSYKLLRTVGRSMDATAKEENPWIYGGANMVGTLATGKMLGSAAEKGAQAVAPKLAARYGAWVSPAGKVAGIGPRIAQAGIAGAGWGAASGLGNSEADDLTGMLLDTGKGAVTGGAAGAALYPVAAGIGAVGSNIAQHVSSTAANNYAQQKVAESILRDARGTVFQSGASNPTQQAISRFNKLGPEATVSDAAGQNTRQLLDTVATLPGRTKNQVEMAIRDRQAGRAGRLVQAADNSLGTNGARYGQTLEALDATRKQAAAPFYRALENHIVTVDDDVANLIAKTAGTHADAQRLYQLQTGNVVKLGDLKPGDQVPFSMLDTLKQSLHDAAETQKRQGGNKMARAIDDARVALTNKLDALAPVDRQTGQSVYKLARDAYSGPSQLIDAAEIGKSAMKADVFDVGAAVRGMTDSELQAFRVGALQALREKTGTQSGQTSLLKMWMEPATRDRLKEIFGPDYRSFAAEVAKEARLKGMEGVGRGSQTASRLYGAGDLDVQPLIDGVQAAGNAAKGNPVGAASAARRFWNSVSTPEPVRDQIGQILLSQGSQGAQNLQNMSGLVQRINQERAKNAAAMGLLGNGVLRGSESIIGRGLLY